MNKNLAKFDSLVDVLLFLQLNDNLLKLLFIEKVK